MIGPMADNIDQYSTFRVFMAEYKTLLTDKYLKSRAWSPPDENHVLAVIPGTILEVRARKGRVVKHGETLLILDAMKMENNIISPFDLTNNKINVSVNDIVDSTTNLIDFEEITE